MSIKSYSQAICEALDQEMSRDKRVILIGQDVRGGTGGSADEEVEAFGGTFGVTKGLWTKYGSDRVIDTPISEASTAGMAAGAALTGMRPVFELMFMSFFGIAMILFTIRQQDSAICSEVKRRLHWLYVD